MSEERETRGRMRLGRGIGERLTYANVTATLALVVALGTGGAYAASKIGPKDIAKNAVRSKHIKAGQVKTPDLRGGAVTSAKIANGQVRAADLGPITQVPGDTVLISPNGFSSATAQCPPGTALIGGGFFGNGDQVHAVRSFNSGTNEWVVVAHNGHSFSVGLSARAICLRA